MRPASARFVATFALVLGTSTACSKKGDSATTHVAALGRELQAFGQNGDVPASAAHREWLIDHIGWNELIGVFIGDVLTQAQPEQRQEAMHAFQIDINEPSDNTMFRRRRSLMRLSIAAGNGKCSVIKASADDHDWARKMVSAPAPTDGLDAPTIELVTRLRAKVAKLDRFYQLDCGRKQVRLIVAHLGKGIVLPLLRTIRPAPGDGPPGVPGFEPGAGPVDPPATPPTQPAPAPSAPLAPAPAAPAPVSP
ncbi:MAG: hypothetical protein IT370_25065 [Deltaproteobacteria bacterium]|nr:hypothetical protein [Deltaproteobacteria bacterium]